MTLILGAHMSMAKGYLTAARETVEELQANALQFFVRSPRGGDVRTSLIVR